MLGFTVQVEMIPGNSDVSLCLVVWDECDVESPLIYLSIAVISAVPVASCQIGRKLDLTDHQ
jgi:hypothetical protein